MRRTRWIESFLQDLRYAWRTLRQHPGFTLVATLSLALGIGANTAVFSLLDALLLRDLPVASPDELVALGDPSRTGSFSSGSVRADLFSVPMYRALRDGNEVFSGLFGSGWAGRVVVGSGEAGGEERARGRLVTGNYFSVLGVPAFRGRTLTAADDESPGAAPYAVLSYDYWQRRFAADPAAVGRSLTLNGYPFTVVGVTPPGFYGDVVGTPTDLWVPVAMQPQLNPGRDYLERWDDNWLLLMGRRQPGVSFAQARSSVEALFARLISSGTGSAVPADLLPDDPGELRLEASAGGAGFSYLRSRYSRPLLTLMAIAGLVLLIACANAANLLLERAAGRQRELSLRQALGAGRGRLVRQLATESLLLAALGGVVGVLLAFWADAALLALIGLSRAGAIDLRPDLEALAFTAAVTLATALLFGLAPALRASRSRLGPVLRASSRSVTGAGAGHRWHLGKALVVAQFALSLLLLAGAGLFVRTLVNLERLDLGYPRDGLVMLDVDPIAAGYDGARLSGFVDQLRERLAAVPGARGVTLSENGLFSGTESSTTIALPGRPPLPDADDEVHFDRVGPDYFAVVGIPLALGHGIRAEDGPGAPRVAVVNEAMARHYFPGESPIGQTLATTDALDEPFEIVGVARDVHDHGLREPVPPRFYLAARQSAGPLSAFNFEVRAADPEALVAPVREAVRALDPRVTILDLAPLAVKVDNTMGDERLVAKLSAVFGLLALALAAIGLYGVVSYAMSRRTNEIGIRMALGASEGRVLGMVLGETLVLAGVGTAAGLVAIAACARLVASRLYGLTPYDPPTLAAATAILAAVAVVAGAIPGARAARVDPTEALRRE
jgi:putative ABC transport system permease protein